MKKIIRASIDANKNSYVVELSDTEIYSDNIRNAEGVLIDNGIDPEDVKDVLQAIGYVLLDSELYPE